MGGRCRTVTGAVVRSNLAACGEFLLHPVSVRLRS
jgi:hypothetical protein